MQVVLLFAVAIILGTCCSVTYKASVQRAKTAYDIPFILVAESFVLTVVFGVLSAINRVSFKFGNIIPGIVSGVSTFVAMVCLFKSMGSGSFGVTIVLANLNFIIPIILSAVFLSESASAWQTAGIITMIAVIISVNVGARKDGDGRSPKIFILWAIGSFLFNGLLNFGVKLHDHYLRESPLAFNFVTFACCFLCSAVLFIVRRIKSGERVNISKEIIPCAAIFTALCGANFFIQSILPEYVNAAVQFTVGLGGAMLAGMLISHIFYKERFTWRSAVTLLGSAVAIILQVV